MKQYFIRLEGNNLRLKGEPEPLGCFTTRLVTARNKEEAFSLAVRAANEELKLNSNEGPLINSDLDPPIWSIDTISEYDIGESIQAPRKGFTFYSPERPETKSN